MPDTLDLEADPALMEAEPPAAAADDDVQAITYFKVLRYAQSIVECMRTKSLSAPDFCKKWLTWGAGPRASLNLVLAAKAHAVVNGQNYVSCDDVVALTLPVLRHRLVPSFTARSEGVTSDDIARRILEHVPKHGKA